MLHVQMFKSKTHLVIKISFYDKPLDCKFFIFKIFTRSPILESIVLSRYICRVFDLTPDYFNETNLVL